MLFKGILFFHSTPCRSRPIQASFVFRTQFKIFWRKACDCLIDCKVIYTVKVQKNMKSIARILHLPSVVQSDCYAATRILFVWKKNKNNDFIQHLGTVTSPLSQRSGILEIIPWTQNVYTLLYQPGYKDESSSLIYALVLTQTAHPCSPADTEARTHFASRG